MEQDSGLDRRHAELVIRELAKFHAISYCMKNDNNENLLNAYGYLAEDSLYRSDTSDFTKRTITPVMASLAELLRSTPKYQQHYEWFVELARNFHEVISFCNKACIYRVSQQVWGGIKTEKYSKAQLNPTQKNFT